MLVLLCLQRLTNPTNEKDNPLHVPTELQLLILSMLNFLDHNQYVPELRVVAALEDNDESNSATVGGFCESNEAEAGACAVGGVLEPLASNKSNTGSGVITEV